MNLQDCCIVCRGFFPSCKFKTSYKDSFTILEVILTDDCSIKLAFMPDIHYYSPFGIPTYKVGETNVSERSLITTLQSLKSELQLAN